MVQIADSSFSGCKLLTFSGLSSLNWSGLVSIGDDAFYNCTSLSGTITLNSSCTVSSTAFSGLSVVRTVNANDSNYYDYAINVSTD